MKPEDIHIGDWQRMMIGEIPAGFYLELILRVVVVYLILLIAMRLMGKRMASQLSRTELIAMASLAASIGVPILAPDRGLLPAFISAGVIVTVQRVSAHFAAKKESFEALVEGELNVLVQEGILQLRDMQVTTISRERVFAQLRSKGLYQLGAVKFLFMEPNGSFTLIKHPEPRPGLSILPQWDREFRDRQAKSDDLMVCKNCGNPEPAPADPSRVCDRCGDANWVPAVS
ncbi:uncharacterized membrane protein YcaP (DUF421 family) [Spirosoma lacussanchae]|uniref:DUF421 domain-containing protein n=1 Tax=Spirosoma lacussanchae TaxID=1884249 RepID=UPI001109EE90|nr:YetF domain-containing protein [Spirosoma lacussanchae]